MSIGSRWFGTCGGSLRNLLLENQGGWAVLSVVVVFSEAERSGSATAGKGVAWKSRLNGRWLEPMARSASSVRTVPTCSGVCRHLRNILSSSGSGVGGVVWSHLTRPGSLCSGFSGCAASGFSDPQPAFEEPGSMV